MLFRSQVFIQGLESRDMRSKLLERELVEPAEVYALAEILERSKIETQQFDITKTLKAGVAENQKETEVHAAKGKKKTSNWGGTTSFGGPANLQMRCYGCGGMGHMRANCTKPRGGGGNYSFSNRGPGTVRSSQRVGRGHGAIMRGNYNQGTSRDGPNYHRVRALSGMAASGGKLNLKGPEQKVYLNGVEFSALLDTGASINYVIKAVVDRLGLEINGNRTASITLADQTDTEVIGTEIGRAHV